MKKILHNSSAILAALWMSSAALAEDIILKPKQVLDVVSGKMLKGAAVHVKDGKIVAVGNVSVDGAKVIDLKEKTLLPGLMDMHVHLTGDPTEGFFADVSYSQPRYAVRAVRLAKRTLMAGFTTVRNLGAGGYSVIAVRDGINAGEIMGPRIWAAGNSIGIVGGHCDNNWSPPEANAQSGGAANGPWAVRAKVRENIKYGANTIKICATGGVFSKGTSVGAQQMVLEEMKAAVDEAHLRGRIIAAHAHGTSGIKDAIRAGVDSIEHCSFLDQEGIDLALKHGTYLSCDIYNTEYTLAFGEANGVPEENINKEKMVSKAQRESFRKAHEAGVKLVFGSDAAIYPHGDNAKQFSVMVKFGMTPLESIQAATITSAALLKQEKSLGQIKAGFLADIIAVDGDPTQNVKVLENVSFVMKDGKVYKK
ncbi:amidohydrolase family protein [Temperatibacter marinus]|uniref:Amidohydrolase family protein n=1 Tax=Temperatibacter marinus TaxID=1456591 RepID=A0AA52EFV0_9PROT|nr:amidohydrolase family protein [Temperatibacter marinus]WND03960.1 amidohydrolase family protein [Temperatibacter marinus]